MAQQAPAGGPARPASGAGLYRIIRRQSIYAQIYMIVGGVAAFTGPILGSVVLTVLSEFIRAAGPLQSVVYGTMLAVVMLFLPGGLVSLGRYFSGWFKKKKEASAHG